jgi:multiple sugar transport system ATP-binding protein
MARVVFEDVTKVFDGTTAVKDLSLEIEDGEFLVLVGPSGCGKSTALRMLAGLERVSDGRIMIGDRVVNNVAPAARDVAMVFQSYALYPHMTVYDNLAFALYNQKVPKEEVEKRVRRAGEILDLGPVIDRKPKQLSGGQRQRVALGRAIVREPAAFLMDEPLSNLDAKLRVATRAEILKLQQRLATTTVYVTHDQVEAMTMGDRIAVMNHGVLQQAGTPKELYEHPTNVFVAGFIGSPAMNLVPVERANEDVKRVLRRGTFSVEVPDELASELERRGVEKLVAGFRPEHLDVAEEEGARSCSINAEVEVVEYLGDEQLVHLKAGDEPVVASLPVERQLKNGDKTCLYLPLEKLRLFDAETEEALELEGQAANTRG